MREVNQFKAQKLISKIEPSIHKWSLAKKKVDWGFTLPVKYNLNWNILELKIKE